MHESTQPIDPAWLMLQDLSSGGSLGLGRRCAKRVAAPFGFADGKSMGGTWCRGVDRTIHQNQSSTRQPEGLPLVDATFNYFQQGGCQEISGMIVKWCALSNSMKNHHSSREIILGAKHLYGAFQVSTASTNSKDQVPQHEPAFRCNYVRRHVKHSQAVDAYPVLMLATANYCPDLLLLASIGCQPQERTMIGPI